MITNSASSPNRAVIAKYAPWGIIATAFLIPLLGGQIYTPASSLSSGIGSFIQEIISGPDLATLDHLVLIIPLAVVLIWRLCSSRVLSFPRLHLAEIVTAFLAILLATCFGSSFAYQSLSQFLCFAAFALAFFAGFACTGKLKSPLYALYALAIGSGIQAFIGIRQWEATRAIDPTWRIFANWNNPNALAGILILGTFCAIAIAFDQNKKLRLLGALIIGLNVFALFLTQSRGGLFALIIGIFAFLVLGVIKIRGKVSGSQLGTIFIGFLLAAVLIFGAIRSTQKPGANVVGQRLTSSSSSNEQSVQFRLNLWKSSVRLMKSHPAGVGLGNFQFYSGEPGLVTQTAMAHDNLLQLGSEASIFAPVLWVLLIIGWFVATLRGKWTHPERGPALLCISAAILAIMVDGVFESNLYFFGTGMAVFLLLGLGLQLAPDGCSPEVVPKMSRWVLSGTMALVLLSFAWTGTCEYFLALSHQSIASQNYSDAKNFASLANSVCPINGEADYIQGLTASTATTSVSKFRDAVRFNPSVKYLRALANRLSDTGSTTDAQMEFKAALTLAPKDLITLRDYLKCLITIGDTATAQTIANQMVSIESTPVFKVRALSELVPLETVNARLFLVNQTTSPSSKIELLKGAVSIELDFANTTVPAIIEFRDKYKSNDWAPMPASQAIEKLHLAINDAEALNSIAKQNHDSASSAFASNASQLFLDKIHQLEAGPSPDQPQ